MKKITTLLAAFATTVGMAASVAMPTLVGAQQASGGGNGLRVAPVRSDLTINAGTSQTVTISVQNVTNQSAVFRAIVNDFQAGANENGQPALILDDNRYADKHSLKRFITPIPNVTIASKETKPVRVTVTVPKDAAGGGYYGAVRFAPVSAAATPTTPGATLSASVGSLILVKVPGDIKDSLSISSFDVRASATATSGKSLFLNNNSLNGVVRFKNNGNIQEQPFGKITVHKGKKVLQSTEINNADPKSNVLPDSIRRFNVPLTKVGHWGKYTIEGNFGYASNGQLLTAKATFYVIPVALIALGVVVLALILFAIFGLPKVIRNYNKRILKRAGRR